MSDGIMAGQAVIALTNTIF